MGTERVRAMSKRISDDQLLRLREFCRSSTGTDRKPFQILDELINSRAEIARLKVLSDSQEEAHALRDMGIKL